MRIKPIWLCAVLCFSAPVVAETAEPLDPQVRHGHYHISFVINADGTAVEKRGWSTTILKDTALEWAKKTSISYSTSAQQAEILEAYTKKSDGRRIDVPKNNYQVETNRGKGKDSPVYSDFTTMTVVFPDVAVGDTVAISYKLVQTEPLFQNHFSVSETFSRQSAFDDVQVQFDYPASLWVQYDARGMTEKEKGGKGDRKVIVWSHANPRPIKNERRDYSVYDPESEIGYAFSTFRNYSDIAAAYGVRALPKAAVTEQIRKLAAGIVQDKSAPRDQARALYEWVATNITYAGNCIGIGAVVPRDLAVVLENKMGDCKDHATLLQALLAARGIQSTQALVNAGSVYRLPKIPVVASVNHVINYIPAFDLYVDSTSDSTPFGMLPFQDQDKPVLLVEAFREGAKTPVSPVGSIQQKSTSILKIAQDGSITGSVDVTQKGELAVQTRAWARKITKEWEDDFVKEAARAQGLIGSGKFEKDDPKALIDEYHYRVNLDVGKFIKLPGAGAFYIYPPMNSARSMHDILAPSLEPGKEADQACSGGSMIEDYVIELPGTMKILSIPDNLKISTDILSYEASYRLKGNHLTIKRMINDKTRGNVCSPQYMAEYKKTADRVMDNLKSPVLYK